jgi:hypothetical protein
MPHFAKPVKPVKTIAKRKKAKPPSGPVRQMYALTFGDVAENDARMTQEGQMAEEGTSEARVLELEQEWSRRFGCDGVHLIPLQELCEHGEEAYVLVLRDGVNKLTGDPQAADKMLAELGKLEMDTQKYGYGTVRDSHARHNICFGPHAIAAKLEKRQGTVIAFGDKVAMVTKMRAIATEAVQSKADLFCEVNHYYDVSKCGIGWHGDKERRIVFGVRVGDAPQGMPLRFQWYNWWEPHGDQACLRLFHGDVYIMSEKAVGTDSGCPSKWTLRHCAGEDSYSKKMATTISPTGKRVWFAQ